LARKKLVYVIIAVLLVGILVLYETDVARTNTTHTVTATIGSTTSYSIGTSDTYFPSNFECFPSVGGLEFRVVSDSTGTPISGENLTAVATLVDTCNGVQYEQAIHIKEFQMEKDGWLMPVFPSGAIAGGNLNITLVYQGRTYGFSAGYPPVGSNCATISVPSGNVNNTNVMNGIGSYCYQG
jgi:hypothetical protein